MSEAALDSGRSWRARLELEVLAEHARSRLGARSHEGPLRIQRPFYPEGDSPLHLYLLHPPGGLVAGDQLGISVTLREGARALITTPAAQKLYRSTGEQSSQDVRLSVAAGACLEWLPTETIVFDGAYSRQSTRVVLEPGAACLAWDIGCFGRKASGLPFERGSFRQEFELWRASEPLLVERNLVRGGSSLLGEACGYAGFSVYGNLYAVPPRDCALSSLLPELRELLESVKGVQAAASVLGELLLVRVLGHGAEPVRRALVGAWRILRPLVAERPPHPPRIWAT
ncbi:MAG: urease accessory protein UreD [Polyangiaceae bacterium]